MSFETTHWSIVRAAQGETEDARRALSGLCSTYWRPVYSYVRSKGHSIDASMDLTQEFFLRLIEKDYLAHVRQEKGRFRTFLLVAVNHFLINEWDKANAIKRGRVFKFISIEQIDELEQFRQRTDPSLSPERSYERQWALSVLDAALQQLESEQRSDAQARRFHALRPYLTTEDPRMAYGELARELALTEGAVKTAVHRLRRRFGEVIREQIAETISDGTTVEHELSELKAALRN